jgi:VCBS repeat-containing protein
MLKNHNTFLNYFNTQKKYTRKIIVVAFTILLLFSTYGVANIQNSELLSSIKITARNIIWDVTLSFNNPGGQNDYVVFGEAPDAHDGPPVDIYDVLKPPAPQPPYIRAWFNDNLSYPYDTLTNDYREYPDSSKVWNLTIQWMPSSGGSPTTITVSWDVNEFTDCEYESVTLNTEGGTPLQDMLMNSSYIFSCPAYIPQNFKIICNVAGNQAPIANPDSYSTNEDTTLTIAAPGVLGNDSDPNSDPLTAEKQSEPSHGTVTLNSNGGFTYIPTANYFGPDSFTYKAYDGSLYSNLATVTITINTVNDPPVAYPDSYSTNEDIPLTITAPGVLGNDVDVDGDTLTAVKVSDPSHGAVTLNSNGGFMYTPTANYNGADSFTYKAYDGTVYSNTVTVSLTINSVNDPPVVSDIPDQTITEGSTFSTITLDNYVSDVDNPDSQMTWTYSGNAQLIVSIVNRIATITTPNSDWYGAETITFRATDPGGLWDEDSATFTVTPVNDPPLANPDSYSTNENTPLTIAAPGVLGNDVDVDGDTLTAVKVSDPSHGTVELNSDGSFTYTPAEDYQGVDTFTYKAYDGTVYSNVTSVTITINPVNQPPVATDDTATVPFDSTNNKIDVLANDDDPDGDTLTITGVSVASHGTTNTDGDYVYYTPTVGYSGDDSFTYTINDGNGGTDTGAVSITVQPNAPPNKPSKPSGTSEGKLNTPYNYSTSTTDPNSHQLYYLWDWGDDTQSDWLGPYNSGATAEATHTWTVKASSVKVKAKDIYGAESDWSESLPITMPLSQHYFMGPFVAFLHLIIRFLRGEFLGMSLIKVIILEGWLT